MASRPDRWAKSCEDAKRHIDDAKAAVEELLSLKSEYEEWKDGLPENLDNTPVAEKLQEVVDLDIDSVMDSLDSAMSELDNIEVVDLPRGFGRD